MLWLEMQYSSLNAEKNPKGLGTTKTFLSDYSCAQVSVEMATKTSPGGSQ